MTLDIIKLMYENAQRQIIPGHQFPLYIFSNLMYFVSSLVIMRVVCSYSVYELRQRGVVHRCTRTQIAEVCVMQDLKWAEMQLACCVLHSQF
jgi:hypothetical protein